MSDNTEHGAPEGLYSVKMELEAHKAWEDHKRAEDRLWLAGMAMQALIRDDRDMYSIAYQSWAMADAMLEVGGQ
jgi:hypothetical protein